MRHAFVTTNATARAFQLAALLLVGAGVLAILAHHLANGGAPAPVPATTVGTAPRTKIASPGPPAAKVYRVHACGGDYACRGLGAWKAADLPTQDVQPDVVAIRSP
jgi:hypothetical protein